MCQVIDSLTQNVPYTGRAKTKWRVAVLRLETVVSIIKINSYSDEATDMNEYRGDGMMSGCDSLLKKKKDAHYFAIPNVRVSPSPLP